MARGEQIVALLREGEDTDAARLDRVFFALSDPVRRAILERLGEGALLVSELATPFDISLQAVSRHIQVLVRAGLVRQERTGRISRCSLVAGPIFLAAVWINRYSKYWQEQFDLLAAALATTEQQRPARRRKRRSRPVNATRLTNGGLEMESHRVVSREQWIEDRRGLLAKEKEFTRLRDELSRERRELPWVRVDKEYVFEGAGGKQSLSELFAGRRQLIVYHLMFDPSWEEACSRCSFWADNFNGVLAHLNQRDVSLVAISRAPFAKLATFRKRMGWSFDWVSSFGSDFNQDYHVSFTPDQLGQSEVVYNYRPVKNSMSERPGISVFYKDSGETIFHTYSCYARGLDMLNVAYHYLDLTPKGRDEAGLPFPMAWVRYHDAYRK